MASPALTGTATAANLTVSGNLINGTTNVLTSLSEKATIAAMNTLQTNLEASINAVPNNYYSKTYIDSELLKKASLISPALTGTATAINLNVSGTLINGTTNLLTSLNSKANTSDLLLLAPLASPAITGSATAVNLTVSGNLINGATNLLTSLNEKASIASMSTLQTNLEASINAGSLTLQNNYYNKTTIDSSLLLKSDKTYVDTELNKKAVAATTYSKTEVNGLVALKTDKLTTDNSAVAWSAGYNTDGYHYIDTGSDALVIRTPSGSISANFQGNVGGAATDGNITFYKTVSVNKLYVDSDLTVAGNMFYKPYIAFRMLSNAIVLNTGQVSTANITIARPNGTNGLYTFTFPAHPKGTEYLVFAQPWTTSTGTSYFTCTASNGSSTVISVWCRTAANAITDANFAVYTVP